MFNFQTLNSEEQAEKYSKIIIVNTPNFPNFILSAERWTRSYIAVRGKMTKILETLKRRELF